MYFVYVLYSSDFDRYYIGQTQNFTKRMLLHNSGRVNSTKPYLPWEKKLLVEKPTRGEAMILERKLKNLNRVRLENFIKKYGSSRDEA